MHPHSIKGVAVPPSVARQSQLAQFAGALALLLTIQGCGSVQSPHVFSDQLTPPPGPDGTVQKAKQETAQPPVSLSVARAEAAAIQRKLAKNIQELGGITPTTTLGLIALSSWALFKGVTHPNQSDLAIAGALGSGALAYSSTANSKARQALLIQGMIDVETAVAESQIYDFREDSENDCVFRRNWTPATRQTGQVFQRKLDTCSTPNWTLRAWRRGGEVGFYS